MLRRQDPGDPSPADVARALELLRRAEARAPLPRAVGPQPFELQGRRLLRVGADGAPGEPVGPRPAEGERLLGASGSAPVPIEPAVAADEVRLAKLAGGAGPRLRAFYGGAGLSCVVHRAGLRAPRLLTGARVQRAVAATGLVRVPRVRAAGRARGVAWVVEDTVAGQHPAPGEQDAVARRLAPALLEAGLRLGARRRPVGGLLGRRALRQVAAAVEEYREHVAPHVGTEVGRLLDDRRAVLLAPVHGDPVLGNVLRLAGSSELVLVDWELARAAPVGTDLAKLVTGAQDVHGLLSACRAVLPARDDDLPVGDQVAVALLVGLAGWRASRAVARAAGRGNAWDRRAAARLRLLSAVLPHRGEG